MSWSISNVLQSLRKQRAWRWLGPAALLGLSLWLAACTMEPGPLPTPMAVAVVPTRTPTPLPPTQDLTILTVTPPPTPTRLPTATPTPIRPLITITEPDAEDTLVLESSVTVRGLVALPAAHTAELKLVALNGRLLAEAPVEINAAGWLAELTIPPTVSGVGQLEARVLAPDGAAVAASMLPVKLVVDTEATERYLTLSRPLPQETAVTTFYLLFDGVASQPVGNRIFISVWTDECQRRVATEAYDVRGSGYWQGFVVVPRDVAGAGCAIARFGEPDSATWREVQLPIGIVAAEADEARGVRIAGPAPGSTVAGGSELLVYGTALGVEVGPVNVSVLLENGRIISQGTPTTDYWGYWELPVVLPPEVSGPAQVIVTSGTRGEADYAEGQVVFTIESGEQ